MPGSAAYSRDADVASAARDRLDRADDLAHYALTHRAGDDRDDDEVDWDRLNETDTFDGSYPGDDLDEALADLDGADTVGFDPLLILRRRLRRAEQHRRRRARRQVRARSGVCVNVHIDLRTLSGVREMDDLDDLVLRGEGWNLTRAAADRLLCDSSLVATLFDGKTKLLDANTAAEQFTRRQRRALAARDGHCVFPGCTREPRHCDAHHLHERSRRGPTVIANGALLCRFHHRLIHEYGWTLAIDDDTGRWLAVDHHGTTWTGRPAHREPTIDTAPAGSYLPRRRRPSHQSCP